MNGSSGKGSDGGSGHKGSGNAPAKLSREIQAKLGDQLRQMYNDVVSEGVPDRFADLLAKIDQSGPKEGEASK